MRTLEQRAMARADEVIDASGIDGPAVKDEVRNLVSAALDRFPFDDALVHLQAQLNPRTSGLKGGIRLLLARVVNALDTRWLMTQAARDEV